MTLSRALLRLLLALALLAFARVSARGQATPLSGWSNGSDGIARHLDDDAHDRRNVLNNLLGAYVLLTDSPTSLSGAVGVFISTRVLLTSAEWVANVSSIQYAVNARQAMKVLSVWAVGSTSCSTINVTNRGDAMTDACAGAVLAVVLTGEWSTSTLIFDTQTTPLVRPNVDLLSLAYWDLELLKVENAVRAYTGTMQTPDVCMSKDVFSSQSQASDTLCMQTREKQLVAIIESCRMGVVTIGRSLVGFSTGRPRHASANSNSSRLMQNVKVLSAEPYRQQLLLVPTVKFDTTTRLASDWSMYQVTPVAIYDANGVQTDCSGVHIAPTFVLTVASCLQGINATSVAYKGERMAVKRVHMDPDFSMTGGATVETDVALLELASRIASTPLMLSTDSATQMVSKMFRIELSKASTGEWVEFLPTDQCDDARGDLLPSTPVQCVGIKGGGSSGPAAPAAAVFVTFLGSTKFIGFQARGSNRFVPLSTLEFFIDAFATGHNWAQDTSGGTALLSPSKQYIVGLRVSKTSQNFCGGSLIAPTYVLTAAHCVSNSTKLWVSVGTVEGSGNSEQLIPVVPASVRIHPKFGQQSKTSYDAAILELYHPALATPVTLDGLRSFKQGAIAVVLGYGVPSTPPDWGGFVSVDAVKVISVPIWSKARCLEFLYTSYDSSMLCAGGDTGQDTCTGDSGSALAIVGSDDKDALVGVVSAGYGCGRDGTPGVYIRVAALFDFINAHVPFAKWVNVDALQFTPRPSLLQLNVSKAIEQTLAPQPAPLLSTGTPAPTSASVTQTVSNDVPSAADASLAPVVQTYVLPALPPAVQSKVLAFFLGANAVRNIGGTAKLFARLSDPRNAVMLYSTADVSALLATIQRRGGLTLNQRSDRFRAASAGLYRTQVTCL